MAWTGRPVRDVPRTKESHDKVRPEDADHPTGHDAVEVVDDGVNEPFPVAGDPQVRSDTPTAAR
jgi:hypothetical protein